MSDISSHVRPTNPSARLLVPFSRRVQWVKFNALNKSGDHRLIELSITLISVIAMISAHEVLHLSNNMVAVC